MNRALLKKILFPLVALLGVAWLWYVLLTPGLRPVVINVYEPAQIYVNRRVADLGTVPTDSKVHHEYLLYNLGGKHLRIENVDTTCGCTVTSLSQQVVAPGGFARLKVELDTSIKRGDTRKKITVHSNDPKRPALDLFLLAHVTAGEKPHDTMMLPAKDPLVLFKGECAACHVRPGEGKSGKELFLADCAMCHGQNATGHGFSGPSLLGGDYDVPSHRERVRTVIAHGSPHNPQMPPFSQAKGGPLTDSQIESLVTFLQYQALQQNRGQLAEEKPLDEADEASFQEARQNPH